MTMDPIDDTSRTRDVSRRTAVLTVAFTGMVGFGVGWGVGVYRPAAAETTTSASPGPTDTELEEEVSKAELEWARGVQAGSDERLAEGAESLLVTLTRVRGDEFIPAAERLAKLLIADSERADAGYFERDRRRNLCSFLADWIEASPKASSLRHHVAGLRRSR
ncbi:MAG: hypothetical protein AB7I19_16470 [Planctomycetota bacterium]